MPSLQSDAAITRQTQTTEVKEETEICVLGKLPQGGSARYGALI
jgi:hypothetical protein